MCIIVYKPSNVRFPNKKTLKTCFDNNPDGCGFMFADKGEIKIHKGFMNFRKFYNKLMSCRNKFGDNRSYVLHFRISTAGGVKQELCHPFKVTDEYFEMRSLNTITDGIAFAHNGILSDFNPSSFEYDINDTMKFNKEILYPLFEVVNPNKPKQYVSDLLLNIIGPHNKLAIMNNLGEVLLVNREKFINYNGCYYSNDSFEDYMSNYLNWSSEDNKYIVTIYKNDIKTGIVLTVTEKVFNSEWELSEFEKTLDLKITSDTYESGTVYMVDKYGIYSYLYHL